MKCLICQNHYYPFKTLLQKEADPYFEVCDTCFTKTPLLMTVSSIPVIHDKCDIYQYHVDHEAHHQIYRMYEGFWLQNILHLKPMTMLFIERVDEALLEMISDFNFGHMIMITPSLIPL